MRALVRQIPDSFVRALSARPPDPPIDVVRARREHALYVDALVAAGASVTVLDADEACPDCVFVEDMAVVVGGVALITRSGAPSRRAEAEAVASALAPHVEVVRMVEPATIDGGDCMSVGAKLFVGRSARTNAEGVAQLERVFGGRVVVVDLPPNVLHLKCVCSPLAEERVLLAASTIDPSTFTGMDVVTVPPEETYAANAVALGASVIVAAGHPRTIDALGSAGFHVLAVATTEVRKADGSLTCQSILFGGTAPTSRLR